MDGGEVGAGDEDGEGLEDEEEIDLDNVDYD